MLLLGVAEMLEILLLTGRMEVMAETRTQLRIQGLLVTGMMEKIGLATVVTVEVRQVVLEVLRAVVMQPRVMLVLLAVVLEVLLTAAAAVLAAKLTHITAETVGMADGGMLVAVAVVVEIPRTLWQMLVVAEAAAVVVQTHPILRFQAQELQ